MKRVLVTDAHTKQALAITQSLGRRGIEVSLVDSSPTAPAFASQYCREQLIAPARSDQAAYVEFLRDVVRRQSYDLLVTCDDVTTWYVSLARRTLTPHTRLILPEHEIVETAMYKDRLAQFALEHGVPITQTYFPSSMKEVREFASRLPGPIVVKGVRSSGARQIRYATRETVEQAVEEILSFGPAFNPRWPMLQDYIPGTNSTVYVLCDRGRLLAQIPWEIHRSYPVAGGVPAKVRIIREPELERLAREVAERIGWHGVAGIAFRLDHRDGRYKLLEINVRFGGTTQAAIDAGFDVPYLVWSCFAQRRSIQQPGFRVGTVYRSLLPDETLHVLANPRSLIAMVRDTLDPRIRYGFQGLPLRVIGRLVRSTWWELRDRLRTGTLRHANGAIPMPDLPVMSPSRRPARRLTAKRFMRLLVAHLAMRCGVLAVVRWLANRRRDRFAILMYHRVGPGGLSADVFARQMTYVATHYRVMPLETLVRRHAAGEPLPHGAMALTFDDGYEDTATVAAPILARLKLPATVFPAVCGVRDREPMWPNVVSAVCHHAPGDELVLHLGAETLRYPLRTARDRNTASEDLKFRLKRVEAPTFAQALDELKTRCADWKRLAWEEAPLLSDTQLKSLRQAGFSVGSHTVSHPILSRIPLAQVQVELHESKRWLEACLGEPVTLFCYPNGNAADYTPAVMQLVQEAGFEAACSTHPGWNDGSASRWALCRFPTSEPSLALFACRLERLFHRPGWLADAWTAVREWVHLESEMLWFERSLTTPVTLLKPNPALQIRELAEEDLPRLREIRPEVSEALVRKRWQRGDRCFIVTVDGHIGHCTWVASRDSYLWDLRTWFRVSAPAHAYVYNTYTPPEFRRQGLAWTGLSQLLRRLQAEGRRVATALVAVPNGPARALFERLGFRPVSRIRFHQRFGRRSWTITPLHEALVPFRRIALRQPNTPVVVLGLSVTGLNVLRNFAARGIPVIGVDCDRMQVGFHTRCAPTRLVPSPEEAPQGLLTHLSTLAGRWHTRPVLYPTTDRFALFVSRHRARLAAVFRIHLASEDLIEAMVDKERFARLMEAHGVPTPRTWPLDGRPPKDFTGFPCVVKPSVSYRFKSAHDRKGFCVNSQEELDALRAALKPVNQDLVVQELIPGEDDQHYSCAAYLDAQGELRGVFTSRKLRQYPRTLGIGSLCESVWEPDVAALGVRVLQTVGFRGLAEVELKRDARDGTLKILEINPRSWIQNQLAQRAGVDLDYLAYLEATGLNPEPSTQQTDGLKWLAVRWDLRAAGEAIRARQLTVGAWWRSLRGPKVLAYWSWTDPAPFARELQQLFLTVWRVALRQAAGSPSERMCGLSPARRTSLEDGHPVRRARPARSWVAGPPQPGARSPHLSELATGGLAAEPGPAAHVKLLTTHPIPESTVWQRQTTLVLPKSPRGLWGLVALPFRLLRLRSRYDLLITEARREDCLFALLQTVLPGRKIPHLMMCCLWKREANPLRAWVKRTLLRLVSRSVTKFIVWSTEEIHGYADYFGIDPSRFEFIPHPSSLDGYAVTPSAGHYLFAGGDSSRDYHTLLEAVRPLDIPVVIASKNPRWKDHAKALAHVRVEAVSPQRFRELMAGARAVVVPLAPNLLQSAGQQTYLNAMRLRKPVIVSEAPGVRDYLRHGQTGWIVPPGDAVALREAIQRVFQDQQRSRRVAEAGAAHVAGEFTIEQFVERNLELARVCAQNGHPC